MNKYSEYSFTPASAYSANVNILPTLRDAVKTAFPSDEWTGREAAIAAVDFRSSSSFVVKLNKETTIQAVLVGTTYVVQYEGTIEYIVFSANTTLASAWVAWYNDHKNHNTPTITTAGSAAVVSNLDGSSIYTDADGKYELEMGEYTMTVGDVSYKFFYNLEDAITA